MRAWLGIASAVLFALLYVGCMRGNPGAGTNPGSAGTSSGAPRSDTLVPGGTSTAGTGAGISPKNTLNTTPSGPASAGTSSAAPGNVGKYSAGTSPGSMGARPDTPGNQAGRNAVGNPMDTRNGGNLGTAPGNATPPAGPPGTTGSTPTARSAQ